MGVDIAWPPTFSSVYATPLLQHQTQLGLNPALITVAKTVGVDGHRCEQLVTQPRHDRPVRTRDLLIASPALRQPPRVLVLRVTSTQMDALASVAPA